MISSSHQRVDLTLSSGTHSIDLDNEDNDDNSIESIILNKDNNLLISDISKYLSDINKSLKSESKQTCNELNKEGEEEIEYLLEAVLDNNSSFLCEIEDIINLSDNSNSNFAKSKGIYYYQLINIHKQINEDIKSEDQLIKLLTDYNSVLEDMLQTVINKNSLFNYLSW